MDRHAHFPSVRARHEIVGCVSRADSAVTKFKPGDPTAIGCIVESDGTCSECQGSLEQFCPNVILTYKFQDRHLGGITYRGYSGSIVVKERFVPRVPTNLNLAGVAPLPFAGFTTYSPMRHWGITRGRKVGVIGL